MRLFSGFLSASTIIFAHNGSRDETSSSRRSLSGRLVGGSPRSAQCKLLLTTGGSLLIVLSAIAVAQTPAPRSDTRSSEIGTLPESGAYMIDKDMRLHRSNVPVTAVQHETALNKGAHELRPPVVIHRWGDKVYMMDDVSRNAPVNYEDQFILDP